MPIDVRKIENNTAAEFFVTGFAEPGLSLQQQAKEIFSAVRDFLEDQQAVIVQERVFLDPKVMDEVKAIRAEAYGSLDDGVSPSYLSDQLKSGIQLAGVQVHAIRTNDKIEVVSLAGTPVGRLISNEQRFLALTGLYASSDLSPSEQADRMLAQADGALKQLGSNLFSVARTWMWLQDILDWYGDFNKVRNAFFRREGLITDEPQKDRLPASTGIGMKPAFGPICMMDLVAALAPGQKIDYLLAGGNQDSAFKYGSAFSRASSIATPGGRTVYVSGTASIDPQGRTEFLDDIEKQIEATIRHVRAVLKNMNCGDDDVVQAMIYSKTPAVDKHFKEKWNKALPWPQVTLVCDVCRDDLLFEIEAAACPGAKKIV